MIKYHKILIFYWVLCCTQLILSAQTYTIIYPYTLTPTTIMLTPYEYLLPGSTTGNSITSTMISRYSTTQASLSIPNLPTNTSSITIVFYDQYGTSYSVNVTLQPNIYNYIISVANPNTAQKIASLEQQLTTLANSCLQAAPVQPAPTAAQQIPAQSVTPVPAQVPTQENISTTENFIYKGFNVGANSTDTSYLHIEITINGKTYLCANKASNSPKGTVLTTLAKALNNLSNQQWQYGVYLTIMQGTNSVWIYAQDGNSKVLGQAQIPNLTTISGNVTWGGSFIQNPSTLPWNTPVVYESPQYAQRAAGAAGPARA